MAPRDWPLVGRTVELKYLGERMADREARGVVIAGQAGVGKSRLALESLATAEAGGLATARVMASRAASNLPFGALAPLLPATDSVLIASSERSDLLRRSATA